MNDTYFYDGAGNPLTGKVPLQVTFKGTGDFAKIRGRATQILNAFLTDVRLGDLAQLTRRVEFPGGAVLMQHSFGVTKVIVYAEAEETGVDKFFGGILIHPHVLANIDDEARYSVDRGEGLAVWQPLEALKTLKAPAVPGSAGQPAEWLVVQVHPTRSLLDNPLGKGAVKIFRVHAPKVGEVCEINRGARYLVSTQDGTEFYLCGQKLQHVPPLPSGDQVATRLRTHKLTFRSFETAGQAELVLIAASPTRLYLLDTRERTTTQPATWHLLASAILPPGQTAVPIGTEFAETVVNGVRTIACSGTTPLGECTSFEVQITPTPLGPEYSGTLALRYVPSGGSSIPEATGTFSSTYVDVEAPLHVDAHKFVYVKYDDAEAGPLHVVPGYPEVLPGARTYTGLELYDRHVAYKAYGIAHSQAMSLHYTRPSTVVQGLDFFRGRVLAAMPTYELEFTETGQTLTTFVGYEFRLKGAGLVWTPLGEALKDYNQYPVSFIPFPTFPIDPPMVSSSGPLHLSDELDPLLGTSELYAYYAPFGGYMSAAIGQAYDTTSEIAQRYEPWNWGLGSASSPPATPTYAQAGAVYYQFPLQNPNDPYDIYAPRNPFLPTPSLPEPDFEVDDWRWDQQLIHFYPKRAAIFNTFETWDVNITLRNSLYGAETILRGKRTREGQLRADEYLARWLPTNVDSFPTLSAPALDIEFNDPLPAFSGSYLQSDDHDIYYAGHDTLALALAWDIHAPTQVSWQHTDISPDTSPYFAAPNYGQITYSAQHAEFWVRLVDRNGAVLFEDEIVQDVPLVARGRGTDFVLGLTPRPYNQLPVVFNDPEAPELDLHVDAEFWTRFGQRPTYRVTPQLLTGYWGRSETGEELTPSFPATTAPFLTSLQSITRSPSAGGALTSWGLNVAAPGFAGKLMFSARAAQGFVLRDVRTGGFLAQCTTTFRGATGAVFASVLHTLIGNASGAVPFGPILGEWISKYGGAFPYTLLRLMPRTPQLLEPRGTYRETALL